MERGDRRSNLLTSDDVSTSDPQPPMHTNMYTCMCIYTYLLFYLDSFHAFWFWVYILRAPHSLCNIGCHGLLASLIIPSGASKINKWPLDWFPLCSLFTVEASAVPALREKGKHPSPRKKCKGGWRTPVSKKKKTCFSRIADLLQNMLSFQQPCKLGQWGPGATWGKHCNQTLIYDSNTKHQAHGTLKWCFFFESKDP